LNGIPQSLSKDKHRIMIDGKTDNEDMKLQITVKTKGTKEFVGINN